MTLRGIDTSKWQAGLPDSTIAADFIIFKATEGVGYVDPDCNPSYQEAKAAGKLLGVYHFARFDGNTPEAEAEFFYKNIKGYIGEAIPVLDLEVDPATPDLAKRFLDHLYALSGVHAIIYLSLSRVNSQDWSSVAADYALWVARYWDMATDVNYDMTNAGPMPDANWTNGYAMWQWTSRGRLDGYGGDLDCNVFYGSADNWHAFARNRPVEVTSPVVVAPPVITPPIVEPPVVIPPVVEPPVVTPVINPTPVVEPPVITPTPVAVEIPVTTPTPVVTPVKPTHTNIFSLIWSAIIVLLRKIGFIK